MSRQYKRSWLVEIEGVASFEDQDGEGLRIVFDVRMGDVQTPNHANIRIYNLSATTANQIQKEGKKVSLQAGYQGTRALIFKGEVIQVRKGRENPVDTYVHLLAKTADQAYNHSVVNKTLAAGHTFKDQFDVAFQAMQPFGVILGFVADLGSIKLPRARVLFGMARDVLRTISFSTQTSWSIQNDKLQMVKTNAGVPGAAIVLNSRSGMIGLPIQTIDGIEVRALLNPEIQPGKIVQIDQASIQQAAFNPAWTAEAQNSMIPSLADDGFYRSIVVDHQGDTRGLPWYTDIIGLRADGQGNMGIGLAARGINVNPEAP